VASLLLRKVSEAFARALVEQGIGRKQSAYDGEVQPSDQQNPNKGIICPWNKTEYGPARAPFCEVHQVSHLHCLVWKNLADFDEWAPEYDFRFCKQLCQYGRNPEQTNRARQIRDRLRAVPAWLKTSMGTPPAFMLPVAPRRP